MTAISGASGAVVLVVALSGALLAPSGGQATVATSRASVRHSLTLYSVAEQEQFIDHADDESAAQARTLRQLSGHFAVCGLREGAVPGDAAFFSFNVYSTAALTRGSVWRCSAASTTSTRTRYCDAAFELNGAGTLIASGGFNFNSSAFTLAVTGGLGRYRAPPASSRRARARTTPNGWCSGSPDAEKTRAKWEARRDNAPSAASGVARGGSHALPPPHASRARRRAGAASRADALADHALLRPRAAQYIDMQDDRSRGEGNNRLATTRTPRFRLRPPRTPTGRSPVTKRLPTDAYTASDHHGTAGTGVLVCLYNFDRDAFCNGALELKGGTLSFRAPRTSPQHDRLAVLGGTYAYRGMKGD